MFAAVRFQFPNISALIFIQDNGSQISVLQTPPVLPAAYKQRQQEQHHHQQQQLITDIDISKANMVISACGVATFYCFQTLFTNQFYIIRFICFCMFFVFGAGKFQCSKLSKYRVKPMSSWCAAGVQLLLQQSFLQHHWQIQKAYCKFTFSIYEK